VQKAANIGDLLSKRRAEIQAASEMISANPSAFRYRAACSKQDVIRYDPAPPQGSQ